MIDLHNFSEWMSLNTNLAASSIDKYTHAINTISNDMKVIGVICKDIVDMNTLELNVAIEQIIKNSKFIHKNKKGNNMYSNALKQYRHFIISYADIDHDYELKIVHSIEKNNKISKTEKETIIKARVGQGKYRDNLIEKYNSKCIMTGIDNKKVLVASHIKPWAVCNNVERVDVNNGLLLCANMDKLFDNGLITFSNNGKLSVSSILGKDNQSRLNIESGMIFDLKLNENMKEYLEYHRNIIFIR